MAGVFGKSGGAYANVNRSSNYMGEAMQRSQDNAFRFRQEKKQKQDEAKAEKLAEAKSYGSPEFKAIATYNSSLNDLTSKQAIEAQQAYLNFKDKAVNAKTPDEKAQAIQGMQKIKNSFDYSQQFPTMLNARREEILKGKASGLYDEESANQMLNSADQMNKGQANLRYDEAGNIRFDVYDKEGNIINENETIESYFAGLNPLKKSTYNEDLLKYQTKYKVDETTTVDPTGRKIIDQRVDRTVGSRDYNNAREYAQGIISKQNEREIIAREHGIDPNDTEALVEFVTNDALNSLQSKYSDERDARLAETRRANIEREKQARINEAGRNTRAEKSNAIRVNTGKGKTPTLKESVIGGVRVIKNIKESDEIPDGVSKGASVFSVKNMKKLGANGKLSATIDAVYKNSDGTMVFEGREFDENGKPTVVTWENPQDQLVFVNSINKKINKDGSQETYTQLNDFAEDLETITKSKKVTQKPKAKTITKKVATKKTIEGF